MKVHYIYCFTCQITGKKYIGQTYHGSRRCQAANYTGCIKFYNAIKKYGWNNFTKTILEDNLTIEEANKKEEYYIKLYNTIEDGYNLKTGGLNNLFSEESRIKMSKSCTSKKEILCIETGKVYPSAKEIERLFGYANANIIACCRGKLYTAYGYHWKYANDENYIIQRNKNSRPVFCIELNQTFESIAEASRQTGANSHSIGYCCRGKTKTAGGYHWKYVEEDK